jgi:hypothetical protein
VRADDENRTAPGGESLADLLRDLGQPALILLDEVLNHVEAAQTVTVGGSTLGRQLLIFLNTLTQEVADTPNSALVYSLQASERESLGAETLLDTLDHLVSRVDAKREPVSGGEVMRVVQRRLFKSLGDEDTIRQVATAYAEAYRKARQAVGGLTAEEQHRAAEDARKLAERIQESYSFHPDLLKLMYHRWGSLPSYQRTRGALQFLASVIYDLWERGRDLQPLISAGDVPLDCDNTRNAFFSQIGQRENYLSVFDIDLTGASARAGRVDRRMSSDSPALQRYRIGTRLASSIMLYSFGARDGEEHGVPEADLIQATTTPGLDRMSLTTALSDLRNELLYLHYTGRRYRFETQANLNKMIADEERKFDRQEVQAKVKATLDIELTGANGVVIWPDSSEKVNDHLPLFQVVYLPLEWSSFIDENELRERLTTWLEYVGKQRRDYKNALAFALPGNLASDNLLGAAREVMAIEALIKQQRQFNFNQEQMDELRGRGKTAANRLKNGIVSLYERVAVPVAEATMYSWQFIELQSRTNAKVHERVMGALQEARLIFDSITPDKLISLTRLTDTKVIKTSDIVGWFFSVLSFTRLTNASVITTAIARGVGDSKLGYTAVWTESGGQYTFPNRTLVYFGRSLRADEIDLEGAVVIETERAPEETYVAPPQPPMLPDEDEDDDTLSPLPPPTRLPPASEKKRYQLVATADKSKVFKVFKAVQNLTDRADRVSVRIEVTAETNTQFDPVWLRNAVEEPLDEADVEAQTKLE